MCETLLDCQLMLAKSLVLIETGGNDFNYAMLEGKTMDQVRNMVPLVVESIVNATRQLISFGVRQVFIPGNFPIGCLPIYNATFGRVYTSDELGCLDGLNAFAKFQNGHLKKAIKELQTEFPHAVIVYFYHALRSILRNSGVLGFDAFNIFKACCGASDNEYNFNMTRLCGTQGSEVCADPNRYISWDGIHMTQQAYKRMSQWLLPRLVWQLNRKVFPNHH